MRRVLCGLFMVALTASVFAQQRPAAAASPNDALLAAVNAYRASRGLSTVVASPTLQAAAQFMAEDVATYGPPATPHISSDGRDPRQRMADAGYPVGSAYTSEIIAWGASSADAAMGLWLNSPPHYAELNDGRYRAAGLGVACWGRYPCVWVVTFGSVIDATFASTPPAPTYHATFARQAAYPTAAPGQVVQWVVAFANTGSAGWSTSGASAVRLGTAQPLDGTSVLATSHWVSANRPAQQTTAFVGPGQDAWFVVELRAPAQPGTYRLRIRPVIDGAQWLEDPGAYVDLVVR